MSFANDQSNKKDFCFVLYCCCVYKMFFSYFIFALLYVSMSFRLSLLNYLNVLALCVCQHTFLHSNEFCLVVSELETDLSLKMVA